MRTQLKDMADVYKLVSTVQSEHDKVDLLNYISALHNRIADLDCSIRNATINLQSEYPYAII